MALEFTIIDMKKDPRSREYLTTVQFEGDSTPYIFGMTFNGSKVYFNDWLSEKHRLSILDGNDCPFNGELPTFNICPYAGSAGRLKDMRDSMRHFLITECSEKKSDS